MRSCLAVNINEKSVIRYEMVERKAKSIGRDHLEKVGCFFLSFFSVFLFRAHAVCLLDFFLPQLFSRQQVCYSAIHAFG